MPSIMRYDGLGWEQIFHEILIARNKKLRCRDGVEATCVFSFLGFFFFFFSFSRRKILNLHLRWIISG